MHNAAYKANYLDFQQLGPDESNLFVLVGFHVLSATERRFDNQTTVLEGHKNDLLFTLGCCLDPGKTRLWFPFPVLLLCCLSALSCGLDKLGSSLFDPI